MLLMSSIPPRTAPSVSAGGGTANRLMTVGVSLFIYIVTLCLL